MTAHFLFLAVFTSIATVSALDEANCTVPQYKWTFNSLGSTPCRVAEQLFSPCNTSLIIGPLDSNFFYTGMTPDSSWQCWCNSVFYSLLSGCALCQGALLNHWSDFSKDCPKWWMTKYPLPIPAGVRVPHWAYLNVQTNDVFNLAAAASAVGSESIDPLPGSPTSSASSASSSFSPVPLLPSTTTTPVFSTSSIISNITTSVLSTSITSSITSIALASSVSPSIGPSPSEPSRRTMIAAGVAGGIVTLGLAVGLFFCYRKRNIKASRNLLMSRPYLYPEPQPEMRKKPHDPHNDAHYLGLNQSTVAQSSRKHRDPVPPYPASSGVVNIGQSPGYI